ncbi:unnamed protein product [Heligmosomoides polygyrus]|uniref:Secreted protein n=1 Tax=Heligmosomoides polygyrus TaxID=6339 RepID=A0A183FLE1_HELPZ|nr:unnamed protein product [Heligmosomoides polygyrus]
MLSTRAVLALFYMLLFGIVIVTSAPNRILMRFGKRTIRSDSSGQVEDRFGPESPPHSDRQRKQVMLKFRLS